MTSLNSFSAASASSIERRRLATDRRQARGQRSRARASVVKAQARVNELKRH